MALPNDGQRAFRLFVTHVDSDGPFLKICGQLDKQAALMIESLIDSSRENFEKGIGAVPPAAIHEGIICAAKYKDGTYYRAKIVSTTTLSNGLVGVHFIDYGNKDIISLSTIRFLDSYDPLLLQLRGQASDYYVARVMHPAARWDEPLLLKLQALLCYSEYPVNVEAQTRTIPIVSILFQGNDLSQHLVNNKYGIAVPVTKQEVLLLQLNNESMQPMSSTWQPSYSPEPNNFTEHVPFFTNQIFPSNPASAMRLQQNVSVPFNGGYVPAPSAISQRLMVNKTSRNPVTLRAPIRQPQQPPPSGGATPVSPALNTPPPGKPVSPQKSSKTYKSRLLEINSQHKVFVSYCEEGPELFAVQLVTDAKRLEDMMDEINRQPHRSLTEPPMIGTVCLGRMSGDRIICRAIVMNLSGQQCKLFFVDFGDTEMVSYYDIFDIPEEFVKPNVFAMRFCLSGVKNFKKGPHLNESFKQLVNGKVLTLRVVAPEGPPLIQYGELYLDNKNVSDLLTSTIKETLQFKWMDMLTRGSKMSILVSYVDSCHKFYVQLSDQIEELNRVMDAVKAHCERSSSPGALPLGAACCAKFPDDGNWYRARVLNQQGGKVTVAYVDYGNEQEISVSDLRTITPELIQLPAQALKCALKGYEDKPIETKSSNQLEMLALEKTLMAHVMGSTSADTMLVSLVDDSCSPPLDVARRMMQLSTPRSHEPKATTPVRKDAPEPGFSSPESADDRKKGFRREKSFKDDRRPRDGDDLAQRGGSFRARDNRDGFDRSGPGRHSEKFAGRPDKGDRRGGSKPWENQSSGPVTASEDTWEESAPPARHGRDFRDKKKGPKPDQPERSQPTDRTGPKPGWKNKAESGGPKRTKPGDGPNDPKPSIQDRLRRDNKFNKQDEWEEKKNDNWESNSRPERPPRREYGGDRRDNWGDKKENFHQKRDFNRDRGERGDRGDRPKSNFTPRDRADRSFGSDEHKSDRSFRTDKPRGPYKPRNVPKDLPSPVPLNKPFPEQTIEANAQHEVSVTWIISPDSFYTQILSLQTKFLDMMHKIPEIYKGVRSYSGDISVGASVLAKYPEDGVLYRATVISTQPFGKYIVQYIDFGNKFVVDARDIWQLDEQLLEVPKMAVHCSLLGVAPKDGEWKANNDIDLCFNAPRYQCVFQEATEEGKYKVSLWNNGASVADMLIEKELAAASDLGSAVTVKDEAIDLSIIVGQQALCRVTHVESFDKFFIQLDLEKAKLVEKAIDNFDATLLTPLAESSLTDGVHCTVKRDGRTHRAILTDTSDKTAIKAVLPDYGINVTTTMDNLMILPTELSVYYYQSLECCLHNYTEESTKLLSLDELKERLTDKKFIVYINDVPNISLHTTLYDPATGAKVAIFTPDEGAYESVTPLCARAVFNYNFGLAYISHVASLDEVYLQKAADGDRIAELLDELYKFYEEGTPEPLESFEVEGLCAAKSSDGNWYRATIVTSSDDECNVQFTDYGNCETLPKDSLKKLNTKFYEPCALALVVGLGLAPLSDDAVAKLKEWTEEKELQVTVSFGTDGWLASLHSDGVDLSMKLVNEKLAAPQTQAEEATPAPAAEEPVSLPSGCTSVYISHIDTPGQFWLQMSDKIDAIEEIQAELQEKAASFADVENRELGTLCIAKYLADDQWYRAEILDADSDITTVRFIDYGNTDVLDNQPGLIKVLPDNLKEAERYAVKSSVNAVPTGTGQWSDTASDYFMQLVGDLSSPVDALIVLKDVTTYVDIFVNGQNLTDKLVAEGHANRAEEPACGDLPTCFASHVNSPSEFWVQLEAATAELQAMEALMEDADNFPELTDKEEGVICAAKYPEDGAWYRAQVIVDGSEGTEVLFMDYGNASIATELRNLPDELKQKPALSRKCALQKPRDIKSWSRKSEVKFNELAAEGATIFTVQFIASGDISIVELFLEGKSVTEELVGLCEEAPAAEAPAEGSPVVEAPAEGSPVVEAPAERPAPLGLELQSTGKVCHVNSTEDFYIHLESSTPDLDKVLERMIDAPDFDTAPELKVGSLCAAFWAEDEQWYRAKILEFCDVGSQVLFVDYGNKAKCEDFRQLPEDLALIEPLAKCCRLALPEGATSNENLKKKFDELTAEDYTFQIELLDTTKEPVLVRLLLGGEDVGKMVNVGKSEKSEEPKVSANEVSSEIVNEIVQKVGEDSSNNVEPVEVESASAQVESIESTEIAAPAEVTKPETETEQSAFVPVDVNSVEPTAVPTESIEATEKADTPEVSKSDEPEKTVVDDLDTTPIDLNESISSNHTVIENKSFEANADALEDDKEVDEGFKSESDKIVTTEKDVSPDTTLESSNDTIKTPEKDESKESINPDTGYTSEAEKSPVGDSVAVTDSKKSEEGETKVDEKTADKLSEISSEVKAV
ncbi:maternal protein tudor isoform X2 [Plutella xylostella]|uniref:maternal protein tudor isoform X2 n=1 Tax=Plutella xylostella TaxID=51655 RepID=UPI00203302ED|nr:maternal protein tudor isoform X2 [Plutella xylostella]